MNQEVLGYLGIKFEKREAYAVDYVSELLTMYKETTGLDETSFVSGRGCRKSIRQKQYEELHEYLERLKSYAYHIETCGEERNSYSKTDHDATFMRLKRDYMGNDQLLPAYNLQAAICDEYIAVIDVKPYASDMECFVPLMEKFNRTYGHYPKYPVADAGYGSYNNYLYCEEHGMEKYMKFTMYKKETTDKKYHENPYRAVNFAKDAYLLRNRKVNTKKRQNRHLPELAFLILGTYFTAPFLFYDAQLIESAMYVTTPRPA